MGIKIELICPGVWSPRHGFHHGALTPTNVLQIFSFCALAVGQVRFTVVCQRAHTSIHTISELSVHVLAVVMQLLFLCCVFLSVSSKFEIRVLKTASAHKRHFIHVNICLC